MAPFMALKVVLRLKLETVRHLTNLCHVCPRM